MSSEGDFLQNSSTEVGSTWDPVAPPRYVNAVDNLLPTNSSPIFRRYMSSREVRNARDHMNTCTSVRAACAIAAAYRRDPADLWWIVDAWDRVLARPTDQSTVEPRRS